MGVAERLVRPHSFAQSMAHRVVRTCDCPAANLARHEWRDPQTGRVRHESMADLFDEALGYYPALAEALVRGERAAWRSSWRVSASPTAAWTGRSRRRCPAVCM